MMTRRPWWASPTPPPDRAPLAFTVSVNPVGGRGVAVSNTTAPSGTNPATPGTEYTASSANAKVAIFTGQMSGSITIPAIAESVDDMAGVTLNATINNPVNANRVNANPVNANIEQPLRRARSQTNRGRA